MKAAQDSVRAWMQMAGQKAPTTPCLPSFQDQALRIKLHHEECVAELDDAFMRGDIVAVADSIADSLVVILGTAVACGIDIEPVFTEVMRSNNTKFIDGHRRADGKWMKGPSYDPAKLAPIIGAQSVPQPALEEWRPTPR